jgi:protein-L-isoaspartate(D-aspartate) O-methyltransferase
MRADLKSTDLKSEDLESERFAAERQQMVASQLRARGIRDERVLAAMAKVPRHEFVAEDYREQAYEDHPIPIDEGQTLSQPYIVAIMLEAAALEPSSKVLEIGTGSGYQTALLAELAAQVYSIERHASLARGAEATLARLGYIDRIPPVERRDGWGSHKGEIPLKENRDGWGSRVNVLVGDGSQGMPEQAPFDAIVVSAAAPRIPKPLFEQLREGGRMVIPVGPAHAQELQLVRKRNGQPAVTVVEGCRFVPLIGSQGYVSGW